MTDEEFTEECRNKVAHAADLFGRHRKEVGFVRRTGLVFPVLHNALFVTEHGAAYIRHRTKVHPWSTTLYAIVSECPGDGQQLLDAIYTAMRENDKSLLRAKCPVDLPANHWYHRRGFVLFGVERRSGRRDINVWHKHL